MPKECPFGHWLSAICYFCYHKTMHDKRVEILFLLTLLGVTIAGFFYVLYPYLNAFILAAAFSVVFSPVYRKLLAVFRNRGITAFSVVVITVIIVFVPTIFLGQALFKEARGLYLDVVAEGNTDAGNLVMLIQNYAQKISPAYAPNIKEYLGAGLDWLLKNLGSVFSGVAAIFSTLFFSLLTLYYFLKDGEKIKGAINKYIPLSPEHNQNVLDKLRDTTAAVVKGSLVVALAQGVLAGLGFFIFGIPQPILLGAIAVFTSFIPAIGTSLVLIPAIIYLLLVKNILFALGLLIWGFAVVGLIDNFIRPRLIEQGAQIHPLLILMSVLGGLKIFGFIGFLAGPLIVSLTFALLEIFLLTFKSHAQTEGE